MPSITGAHHIALALTVTDADRSAEWYGARFRMSTVLAGAETPIGSVMVFRDPDNIRLECRLPAG